MWRFLTAPSTSTAAASDSADLEKKAVDDELALVTIRTRSKPTNNAYTAEQRAAIGKYAAENGNIWAVRKFTKTLGFPVPESTVRTCKKLYIEQIKKTAPGQSAPVTSLPHGQRGKPLKLGWLDAKVQTYLKEYSKSGVPVNRNIVKGTALGLLKYNCPNSYKEIELTDAWARSLMTRMSFVKRKGTKAARNLPDDFNIQKDHYIQSITTVKQQYDIPQSLVINWDQTALKIIPTSDWTLAPKGAKQVPLMGLEDKRQITALLAVTESGTMLPPQLIYAGVTAQCHPSVQFPHGWNITHSKNHWSNETTMLEYIDAVLLPYIKKVRQDIGKPNQQALAIFDVFAAHRVASVKEKLSTNNITYVFVPPSCTSELQPLDLTFNSAVKQRMKGKFMQWYADQTLSNLMAGTGKSTEKVKLPLSLVKPIHAQWVIDVLTDETILQHISSGFVKAGITSGQTMDVDESTSLVVVTLKTDDNIVEDVMIAMLDQICAETS